jgi:hypothetical protein
VDLFCCKANSLEPYSFYFGNSDTCFRTSPRFCAEGTIPHSSDWFIRPRCPRWSVARHGTRLIPCPAHKAGPCSVMREPSSPPHGTRRADHRRQARLRHLHGYWPRRVFGRGNERGGQQLRSNNAVIVRFLILEVCAFGPATTRNLSCSFPAA